MQIPLDQIRFHSLSIADPGGRVFWWNNQLYRAVPAARADHYRDLFARQVIQNLVQQKLLVQTEITDLQLPGYEMVLHHRVVEFVTYAPEWPGGMIRAAADLILSIQQILLADGLMLQDAHPFNVLFDGVHPLFVDVGSIVPAASGGHWPAMDEFKRFFVHPLQVMAAGHARVARWLLHDYNRGITAAESAALCSRPDEPQPASQLPAADAVHQARQALQALVPAAPKTEWSTYSTDKDSFPSFSDEADWNEKHRAVRHILNILKPATMLDIGSNRGWFSQLAARAGTAVLAADVDEQSLNLLHADVTANGLNIQPIVMDFANPLPGYGINHSWFVPAMDRLGCDLVLALAVVHHMVYKQYLRFEHIAAGLAALSNRWVVVEFIAKEDVHVSRWKGAPAWYTLDQFVQELQKHFRTIQSFPSDIDHRVILLCEK